ncbi:PRC-barrel domain containing protein [Natronoarchaeum mannanilyticum]|uniref:PRC-barrel domain containing protein n=1 Tax=Natronoarchaeum mannanilyticum TaxID=926360 RepID=A0AAV3TBB0_9EURY
MARTEITDDDQGKKVVNDRGDEIGMVKDVRAGTAHVDPDPGMTDQLKSKLGWGDTDDDTYPLQEEMIEDVTDDEIRVRGDM